MTRLVIASIMLFNTISLAEASCVIGSFSFNFGETAPINAVVTSDPSSNAGRCMLGFRGGTTVSYDSITPLKRPSNGKLEQHSSKLGWIYAPKPGFKGTDTVGLRVCGKYERNSGCTIVNYSISVR
jgi:hypothetical protein